MLDPGGHGPANSPPYGGAPPRPSGRRYGRATRGQARRRQPPPGRTPRSWGSRPGRLGVFVVIGCAALGGLVTVVEGREPGPGVGLCLVPGAASAPLAARPRA